MDVKSTIGNVVNAIWNNALTLQEIRTSGNLTKKVVKAEAIKSLDDNLGSAWSSTASYVAGQYVIYQNYIYRCIKNAAAGTAPTNATYWEKTNLASEITALNSNLAKRFSYTVTNAGITVPNNVHANAIVVGHYTNDHYLLDVNVQGLILKNGTGESFDLLSISRLLSPIKSALGKNNTYICDEDDTVPLVNNGAFLDNGLGPVAIINNSTVGFGRFYKDSLSFGRWPMNNMKQNGGYSFRFYAEIY